MLVTGHGSGWGIYHAVFMGGDLFCLGCDLGQILFEATFLTPIFNCVMLIQHIYHRKNSMLNLHKER